MAAPPGGAWLVTRLQQAVEAGFKVATGSSETLRPWGLLLLQRLVVLFDGVLDPDFDGHCLLEQYQVNALCSHDALYWLGLRVLHALKGEKPCDPCERLFLNTPRDGPRRSSAT